MPTFTYCAKRSVHESVHGKLIAENSDDAVATLLRQGLVPVSIERHTDGAVRSTRVASRAERPSRHHRVRLRTLAVFTRNISDLVESAVPLMTALDVSARQAGSAYFKEVTQDVHAALRDGGSFADAVARHPGIFSAMYVEMVRAGEGGSELNAVLNQLAGYLEAEQKIRDRLLASIAYPLVVVCVGVIAIVILLVFVLPRITLLADATISMPLPTMIVIAISNAITHYWWAMAATIAAVVFAAQRFARTDVGRMQCDRMIMRVPGLRKIVVAIDLERFCRTLSVMVAGGLELSAALRMVRVVINNRLIRQRVDALTDDVANGAAISVAVGRMDFFSPLALSVLAVGEQTGNFSSGLRKAADMCQAQVETYMQHIVAFVGPVLLIGIALIVGCIVMAVMLPIVNMNVM